MFCSILLVYQGHKLLRAHSFSPACRNGKSVGASVQATGLWIDVLNSPYHSFGTECEDASYFQKSNKEYKYTAIDVSERNVLAMLHELRTGQQLKSDAGELHRSDLARGPTNAEVSCRRSLLQVSSNVTEYLA
jgi:Domain of unknown function (DUF4471)